MTQLPMSYEALTYREQYLFTEDVLDMAFKIRTLLQISNLKKKSPQKWHMQAVSALFPVLTQET